MGGLQRIGILLFVIILLAGTDCHAQRGDINQKVNIQVDSMGFYALLKIISQRSGMQYFIADGIENRKNISVSFVNVPLYKVLDRVCKDQQYEYKVYGNLLLFRPKIQPKSIKGKVLSESGEPVEGATITIKNAQVINTKRSGEFTIHNCNIGDVIAITHTGYQPDTIICGQSNIVVMLRPFVRTLEAVSVIEYSQGRNRKANSAGNNTPLRNSDMDRYAHFIGILPSLSTGFYLTRTSGMPARNQASILIRGRSSIGALPGSPASDEPLIIVDGVSFGNQLNSSQTSSPYSDIVHVNHPMNNINPLDIESIKILKDADATILYGSKGANGVIVVTTKRGKWQDAGWTTNVSSGIGKVNRAPNMMNTEQYLAMRREALGPEHITSPGNWDTAQYTDFSKKLSQRSINSLNLHTAVSGGDNGLRYYLSAGYYHDKSFLPREVAYYKNSFDGHFGYRSTDEKLSIDFVSSMGSGRNNSTGDNLTGIIWLPPNTPEIKRDEFGRITQGAQIQPAYTARTTSFVSSMKLKYERLKSLRFSLNLGHNKILTHQSGLISRHLPDIAPVGTAYSMKNVHNDWIVEPMVQNNFSINKLDIDWVMGATWQRVNNFITTGFNDSINFRYNSFGYFSNFTLQFDRKYQLSLSLRRDQSNVIRTDSRGKLFGAVGAQWSLHKDSFFIKAFPFISNAKLKASFGVIGDDQVDLNNHYYYYPNSPYWNKRISLPKRVIAENYDWQVSRKFELGIEFDLFKKLTLRVDYYRRRTGNQVIGYPDPTFGLNVLSAKNSAAVVENTGVEILLQLKNSRWSELHLNTDLSLTIPRNKLVSFPGITNSPYAYSLVVGQPLTVQQGYHYTGVNPATGLFEVADLDGNGRIEGPNDYKVIGDLEPKLYGNFKLNLEYKKWSLWIYVDGRVQKGYSQLFQVYASMIPGTDMINLPTNFLDRWRKPGDYSSVQRISSPHDPAAINAVNNFLRSDARLVDASYIRLSNIYLKYKVPVNPKMQRHLDAVSFFLSGENLFTITKYKGSDPETQNIFMLPPLLTFTAGMQISL